MWSGLECSGRVSSCLALVGLVALGGCGSEAEKGTAATADTAGRGEEEPGTDNPGEQEPPPELPDVPTQTGPYPVGVTTMRFTDSRGKELVAEVWYPAVVEAGDEPDPYEPTVLSGDAFRDVAPDLRGAPYPVLAFSHGMAGIRFQSVFLTEHLASWGYVTVSPDHPRNTFLDIDPDATVDVVLERPDDVRHSVDELALRASGDDPYLSGLIGSAASIDSYVILGHSFGALTSLIMGGGTVDFDALFAHCSERSSFACGFIEGLDASMLEGHGLVDERITHVVPYAPGVWYAFGENGEGLADVAESLVFLADSDTVLPYRSEGLPTYEALSAPKIGVTFAGAGHYAYSDICELVPFLFEECTGTGWLDIEVAHDHTLALTTAWLQSRVRGDARMEAWLEADHWSADSTVSLERED